LTHPAEWNPIPHRLEILCPHCQSCAAFEFAEVVRIQKKSDIHAFEDHPQLEYHRLSDPRSGQDWHAAVHFPGLQGPPHDLPHGYTASDWEHSPYLRGEVGLGWGSVRCGCGVRQKHTLQWPKEAYFQIEYRGQSLWAFHRESVIDLRNYIQAAHRNLEDYRWRAMLRHVPSVFLAAKARKTVVKRLDRCLTGP